MAAKSQRRTRTASLVLGVATLLAVAACGGEDQGRLEGDSREIPEGNLTGCNLVESLDLTLIPGSDFESSLATGWIVRGDGSVPSEGADTSCPQDSSLPCSTEVAEAATTKDFGTSPANWTCDDFPSCDTGAKAVHIRAEGLYVWGGQFWYDYNSSGETFDASAYDGVAFWAKLGQSGVGNALFIAFEDKYTKESAYELTDADGNPILDEDGQQAYFCADSNVDTEKCDRFGAGIGLETQWRYFKVPFSKMAQRGYGVASDRLHTEELYGFGFYFDVGDWDFWIDEVSYYQDNE